MSNLNVKLVLNLRDRVSSGVSRMARRVRSSLGSINRAALSVGRSFQTIGKGATTLGAGLTKRLTAPLLALGILAVKKAASFEDYAASLETATGSVEKAEKAWASLLKFTAETPFQLDEVVNAYIKLKNLGLDPSEASLRSYGNTASAMGKSLDQLIEAVADASTFEFERLKEFGIKARQQGNRVAFTFQGQTTVVKKNADAIQQYLKAIGDEKFAGNMEKRMRGLNGIFSNFQDSISTVMASFGKDISETLDLKKIITEAADNLRWLLQRFKELPVPMQEFIIKGILILSVLGPMIMAFGQLALGLGFAIIGFSKLGAGIAIIAGFMARALIPALLGASKAAIGLALAFLATPFGLIIAAIALIAGAGYLIITNWDKVKAFWTLLWEGIKQTVEDAVDYVRPLIEWMAGALSRVVDGLNSAKTFITDNAITRGVSGLFSDGSAGGGASIPAVVPSGQNMNAGGVLNIKIDGDGRPRVVENRPSDSRMRFAVDTGVIMGGAQ